MAVYSSPVYRQVEATLHLHSAPASRPAQTAGQPVSTDLPLLGVNAKKHIRMNHISLLLLLVDYMQPPSKYPQLLVSAALYISIKTHRKLIFFKGTSSAAGRINIIYISTKRNYNIQKSPPEVADYERRIYPGSLRLLYGFG